MNSRFHSRIRSGLVALGVLAGLCVPAAATPLTGVSRAAVAPAIADTPSDVLNVNHRRYRCYDGRCGQKYGRSQLRYKYWNGNSYRNGNNYWNGDDWRYRKYRRHYRRHLYAQPYFYFNAPTYRYVQPRRYYRGGLGSAHVAWCYDRYRSYRQWDNTFQPYHGPRQQCWSPYS